MTKTYRYAVTGSVGFPFDMLRYDRAWPRNEQNASVLETYTRARYRGGGAPAAATIELEGLDAPTVDRWASFGWRVGAAIDGVDLRPMHGRGVPR